MKRIFLILLVLSLSFFLAGAALGASVTNPPKTLCLKMGWSAKNISMVIKNQGSIKFGAAPAKFYSITGEIITDSYSFPITGTGHMYGNVFHFGLNGSYFYGLANDFYSFNLEGKWDLSQQSGICNWRTNNDLWQGPEPLNPVSCSDLDLIY
jgi:hypothetical protein